MILQLPLVSLLPFFTMIACDYVPHASLIDRFSCDTCYGVVISQKELFETTKANDERVRATTIWRDTSFRFYFTIIIETTNLLLISIISFNAKLILINVDHKSDTPATNQDISDQIHECMENVCHILSTFRLYTLFVANQCPCAR